jgi:hypothetical protein
MTAGRSSTRSRAQGDPAALEPLSAKLADPVLADTAAGAIATIAARADSRGRAIKLLERGLGD